MKQLELKVPPLAVFIVFAVAIVSLGTFAPFANAAFPDHRAATIGLILVGVVIAAVGIVQFHRAGTSPNPMDPGKASAIVTSGVFGFSRNPMYLGMAVALLGVATWHSSLPGYALLPLFFLYMTQFQIKPEERVLLSLFGDEFSAYMARVRRWI